MRSAGRWFFLLLPLLAVLWGTTTASPQEDMPVPYFSCWFTVHGSAPLSTGLVWGYHSRNPDAVDLPHDPLDNHISIDQGSQLTHFEAGDHPYAHTMYAGAGVADAYWQLAGNVVTLNPDRHLDESFRCAALHRERCTTTIAHFCDDGVHCNGPERCVTEGFRCTGTTGSPCDDGQECDEDARVCRTVTVNSSPTPSPIPEVQSPSPTPTPEVQSPTPSPTPEVQPTPTPPVPVPTPVDPPARECERDRDCQDGKWCNGLESCDGDGHCHSAPRAGWPCAGITAQECNEAYQYCVACHADTDCDDGNPCTTGDRCLSGLCVPVAPAPCQSAETGTRCEAISRTAYQCYTDCQTDLDCAAPASDSDRCAPIAFCDSQRGGGTCRARPHCYGQQTQCDPETGACWACATDSDCDDGLYCNGVETCNQQSHQCVRGADPCEFAVAQDPTYEIHCVEAVHQCVSYFVCNVDVDCDNGIFCDGTETCNQLTGECEPGRTCPCTRGQTCNETDRVCEIETGSVGIFIGGVFAAIFVLALVMGCCSLCLMGPGALQYPDPTSHDYLYEDDDEDDEDEEEDENEGKLFNQSLLASAKRARQMSNTGGGVLHRRTPAVGVHRTRY